MGTSVYLTSEFSQIVPPHVDVYPLTLCCAHFLTLQHPLAGLRDFVMESVKLAYGEDSPLVANKQVAAVQSLSGTGSCRLFAEFQKRFLPNSKIYIPVVSECSVFCVLFCSQLSSSLVKPL